MQNQDPDCGKFYITNKLREKKRSWKGNIQTKRDWKEQPIQIYRSYLDFDSNKQAIVFKNPYDICETIRNLNTKCILD